MVNFESKPIACNYGINIGFSSSMAFSCDCIGDEYTYPVPLNTVKIYLKEKLDGNKMDITDYFMIADYNGEMISLEAFFEKRENWHDGFQFELVKHDLIPSTAIFIAEVFLESGKTFVNQTKKILFY